MHRLILLLMFALFASSVHAVKPSSHVGMIHPPLPGDCKDLGGGVIGDSHEFAYAHMECGGIRLVWLERFIRYDGQKAVFKVVDERVMPIKGKSEVLEPRGCSLKGEKERGPFPVFGIGRLVKDKDGFMVARPVTAAWRLNYLSGKIEPIPANKLVCEYESGD